MNDNKGEVNMPFRGYMESSADLIARINQLDESFQWVEGKTKPDAVPTYWELISFESKRVLAIVRVNDDDQFVTYYVGSNRAGFTFIERDGAMKYAKFRAVKETIESDIRHATVQ